MTQRIEIRSNPKPFKRSSESIELLERYIECYDNFARDTGKKWKLEFTFESIDYLETILKVKGRKKAINLFTRCYMTQKDLITYFSFKLI